METNGELDLWERVDEEQRSEGFARFIDARRRATGLAQYSAGGFWKEKSTKAITIERNDEERSNRTKNRDKTFLSQGR
jgi:hypothetical protein